MNEAFRIYYTTKLGGPETTFVLCEFNKRKEWKTRKGALKWAHEHLGLGSCLRNSLGCIEIFVGTTYYPKETLV